MNQGVSGPVGRCGIMVSRRLVAVGDGRKDSKDLQSDTTSPAASAKRRLTERIIPQHTERISPLSPPHTWKFDEFKEAPLETD